MTTALWRAALALCFVGCSNGDETPTARKMPSTWTAKGCLEDARLVADATAANPMAPPPPSAARGLACPQLYSKADCGRAWAGLYIWREGPAKEDPQRLIAEVDRVISACAVAYCSQLPAGVRACRKDGHPTSSYNDLVDLLIELDRAVLIADKFDAATADALSRRTLYWRQITGAAPPRADAGPPQVELVLTISADGKTSLAGKAIEPADLLDALSSAARTTRSLVIAADKRAPYKQVMDVIEQAKRAGFEKLAIKTEGAPP
jgi:hypothetical protein